MAGCIAIISLSSRLNSTSSNRNHVSNSFYVFYAFYYPRAVLFALLSFLDRFLFDFDDSRRAPTTRGFAITADDHMGLSAGGSGGGADGGGGAVFAVSAALIASTSASVSLSFSSASKSSSESSKIA